MKAILLAAGLGTRLQPFTHTIPKCLVPVGGKPLLQYWLEELAACGIEEILINTHHHAHKVHQFVAQSEFRERITVVQEKVLPGTGGTLVTQQEFWKNDDTLVIHADNFSQVSLSPMIEYHRQRPDDIDCTLLMFETDSPSTCGILTLDEKMRILEFHEKVADPPGTLASGALFIFSKQIFPRYFCNLVLQQYYDLSAQIVPKMLGRIQGWKAEEYYRDIGSPESLKCAEEYFSATLKKRIVPTHCH